MPVRSWLCFIFFVSVGARAWSAELYEYGQSIRALGMGNAYTAIVNDSEALLYNPAALSKMEEINFTLLNLNFGVNGENAFNSIQEMSSYSTLDDYGNIFGDQLWFGLGGRVALTMPNFGAALYNSSFASFEMRNPVIPQIDGGYVMDIGLLVGGAVEVAPNTHFGMNVKRISRTGDVGNFGIATFANDPAAISNGITNKKGIGYGMDIGLLYKPDAAFAPTFSAVWKDVGVTSFVRDASYLIPSPLMDQVIFGMGWGFDAQIVDMTLAVDYKHVNTLGEEFSKKLHMGMEIGLPLIDVRGGFSQGYYTIGASLDLFFFRLDFASYGVELGEYAGQDEDRRWQAQLSMEFGFDPSFNLINLSSSANGKKRKLKQRR